MHPSTTGVLVAFHVVDIYGMAATTVKYPPSGVWAQVPAVGDVLCTDDTEYRVAKRAWRGPLMENGVVTCRESVMLFVEEVKG